MRYRHLRIAASTRVLPGVLALFAFHLEAALPEAPQAADQGFANRLRRLLEKRQS